MALFITFEGGEGSGKSFQAKALFRKLCQLNIPAVLTHEPGGTFLGNKVARLLKWAQDVNISPFVELMLFNASRAQLVTEVIKPALKRGKVVICDRFSDSTIAYQGYGRGLELEMVKATNNTATQGLKSALTILLDISAEDGLARKRGGRRDRFEKEALAFHRRVRAGYLKLAKAEPERWLMVNASQSKREIAEILWQRVSQLLSAGGG